MTDKSDLAIDQLLALRTSAGRLQERFSGVFHRDDRAVSLPPYDEFATRAAVVQWLPLFAERFAGAAAHGAGPRGGPQRRSPADRAVPVRTTPAARRWRSASSSIWPVMAIAWSGGSEPASQINLAAIEAMAERGIDISREFPKPWTDEVVRAADVIVTMGCGDACPIFPGKRYEDWTVDDPADLDLR